MTNQDFIDPANVSPWSTGMRYGAIGSVILIALGLIMHLAGMNDYEAMGQGSGNWLSSILSWVVYIGTIVMAVRFHRDNQLGGYISFGRAFGIGMIATLAMAVISAIWTYLFFSVIAPEVLDIMSEAALENMPADQAEQAGDMMGMFMSGGFMSIAVLFGTLFTGAIISLIVAAIMKKPRPNFA